MRTRSPLSFTTPASIVAFCEAEGDRLRWRRGEADEPHLEEPVGDEDTTIRFRRGGPDGATLLACPSRRPRTRNE